MYGVSFSSIQGFLYLSGVIASVLCVLCFVQGINELYRAFFVRLLPSKILLSFDGSSGSSVATMHQKSRELGCFLSHSEDS